MTWLDLIEKIPNGKNRSRLTQAFLNNLFEYTNQEPQVLTNDMCRILLRSKNLGRKSLIELIKVCEKENVKFPISYLPKHIHRPVDSKSFTLTNRNNIASVCECGKIIIAVHWREYAGFY